MEPFANTTCDQLLLQQDCALWLHSLSYAQQQHAWFTGARNVIHLLHRATIGSNQSLSGLCRLKREAKSCCVLTADDLEQWSLPRSPGLTKKRIFRSRATAAPRPGGCLLPTGCQCLRRSGLSAAIGHCALLWSGRFQL